MSEVLPESLSILLDHAQQMERREEAARLVREEGDRQGLALLLGVMAGSWEREGDSDYLRFRRLLALTCERLWRRLREGSAVFMDWPQVNNQVSDQPAGTPVGRLGSEAGTSLYEFHWEYPVIRPDGVTKGVRKDLLWVIEASGTRTPMLDWCKANDVIVFCSRCGAVITSQVNMFGCRVRPWYRPGGITPDTNQPTAS